MVGCPNLFSMKDNDKDGLDASANGPSVWHVHMLSVIDTLENYYMVRT
jgi:hypothetical protein